MSILCKIGFHRWKTITHRFFIALPKFGIRFVEVDIYQCGHCPIIRYWGSAEDGEIYDIKTGAHGEIY